MATTAIVHSEVDAEITAQATAVLESMGLTVSDLLRIVLTRVAQEHALPFTLEPNELTQQTLEQSARGEEIHHAPDAESLFRQLGI